MDKLSDLCRGRYNRCLYCTDCDALGKCNKLNKDVSWFIENNKQPKDCPKKRRNEK